MTYSAAIRKAIPCGLIGLFAGGYLASVLLGAGIASSNRTPQLHDWLSVPIAAFPLLAIALLFAAPVTLLIGCPLYAALFQRGRATYISTLFIVLVIAAVAFVAVDPAVAYLVTLYGVPIGLTTHLAQRVRSNKSFKPNPLRGSA
jgi:prepilin signal peptidase PulO-like enzyme (type II secretory pathway)